MVAKDNFCFWLATAKTIFSSETDWPNGAKLGSKHLCNVLYKVSSFHSVWPTNMVVKSNYCFWLANIKKSSPLKLLGQIKPNLTGSIYVRSSIKLLHLVPFGQQTWPSRAIFFSDWIMLSKSSPLKLLGQMKPNLAGSIYVRSSINYLCFVPFGQQIWLPRAILVFDWLMLKKSSPLKLLGQIKPNLAGSIYRFLLYIPRRVFHLFLFSNRGCALYNWTNSSHIFLDRIWLFVYGKMMFLFGKPVLYVGFFDNTVSKETLQWVFMNSNLPANHFTVQWLVSHFHHCQFFKYRKS